jgi:hypothetical protein
MGVRRRERGFAREIGFESSSEQLLSGITSTISLDPNFLVDEEFSMELQPGSNDVQLYARRGRNSINSGDADPYVNQGVWGLQPDSFSMSGTSAIPYILAGRDSFASRLFFEYCSSSPSLT